MTQHGFGRLPGVDPRDQNFTIARLLAEAPPIAYPTRKYWWQDGFWGDQKDTPMCVSYSLVHWLEDGPISHKPKGRDTGTPFDPAAIYREAQELDEFPGNAYEGTTVRAGAKALQARGLIESYHWAWSLDETIKAILSEGPVVIGSNWYSTMMDVDLGGILSVGGTILSGHAYVLNGVTMKRELVRAKNSWGRQSWGVSGYAYIRFTDLERLIREDGEVMLAVEAKDQ